eukprot:TRINITY_DN1629_c0_g1_i1.p1 TRINITY_DN1629_c0_g1~~TRINITY_DN1629_c0_g1_i1.p1  ORF type:complete len:190 (-),score=43.79 TRINITY_DN1629_c0_g1_i1:361-930(-)
MGDSTSCSWAWPSGTRVSRANAAIKDHASAAAPSSSPSEAPPCTGVEAGPEAGAGSMVPHGDGSTGGRTESAASTAIPSGVSASPLEGGDAGQWEREKKTAGGRSAWNQTPTEVNVEIDVEKCTKQDIKVVLSSRKISVKRRGEVVLEGNLFDKMNVEESTWHLEEGKRVVLSLEKIKPAYWNGLFEGN